MAQCIFCFELEGTSFVFWIGWPACAFEWGIVFNISTGKFVASLWLCWIRFGSMRRENDMINTWNVNVNSLNQPTPYYYVGTFVLTSYTIILWTYQILSTRCSKAPSHSPSSDSLGCRGRRAPRPSCYYLCPSFWFGQKDGNFYKQQSVYFQLY